jgi:hypothetical protein
MRIIKHLSFEELAAAAAGRPLLAPLDDHLRTCRKCRQARMEMNALQATWVDVLGGEHLAPDDLRALRDEALSPADSGRTWAHVHSCLLCEFALQWIKAEGELTSARMPSRTAVQATKVAYRRAFGSAWVLEVAEVLGNLVARVIPVPPLPALEAGLMAPGASGERSPAPLPRDSRPFEHPESEDAWASHYETLRAPTPASRIERPRHPLPPSASRPAMPGAPDDTEEAPPPRPEETPPSAVSKPARLEGPNCTLVAVIQRALDHRVLLLTAENPSGKNPITGLQVVLSRPSGHPESVVTDAEGRAVLELPLGHSRLLVPAEALEVDIYLHLDL